MSTTTINITLPTRLKKEIQNQVKKGMYTSVSEFIRNAVRNLLTSPATTYNLPFSPEAEKEILKAEKQALLEKNPVIITSQRELKEFFDKL